MSQGPAYGRGSAQVPVQKIADNIWEIPQSYQPGMRVPGRVYADDDLMAKMRTDATLQQCANVATIPGIQKWSITMPDGHEGYGFPIGGVAAVDYDEGVISPGGIGYDINCLSAETQVLSRDGFRRSIAEFANCWKDSFLKVFDLNDHVETSAPVVAFLRTPPKGHLHRIKTQHGREIVATGDHPILTPSGMKPSRDVTAGDRVATYPFEGVPYSSPETVTVLKVADFGPHVAKELVARGLLPLKLDNPKVGALARLVGYAMGDGYVSKVEVRHVGRRARQRLLFALVGERDGLEDAQKDIQLLGYKASRVYTRSRRQRSVTRYAEYETLGRENAIHSLSRSFASLIVKLGVPTGKKTRANLEVPSWIRISPLWVKRNFLGGLFGAELSRPAALTKHPYTFGQLMLTVSREKQYRKSGIRFLLQIKTLLQEFGVESYLTKAFPLTKRTVGLRLVVRSREDNLIGLWSHIGYEYNKKRQRLACLAVEYLRMKRSHKSELKDRSKPIEFSTFENFVRRTEGELGPSGMVYDTVVAHELVEGHRGPVYDFTVSHKDHNFVANGFVVSNCGVRLIRTNLTEQEVRPVLGKLLDALFQNVPSGLGSRGKVRMTPTELEKAVSEGVEWAIDRGYGWSDDKKHCEEDGCMETANPNTVSPVAKQRGSPQLGSLGSGNHFLEIERVDNIVDKKAAEVLGIEKEGQVLVLVHTGSRGFGHQICSDYLRVMERALQKYNIRLPDRQLACAPAKSREAEDYIPAMSCAANFAWVNRQMITHWTREAFERAFGKSSDALGMRLIYDVAHNIAKIEDHEVEEGKRMKVIVHRKGATRSFPPGHPEIPPEYREIGQPVLIPGSMGTASWVLIGTPKAMQLSFGTTAHGAGRSMSRAAAKRRNPPHQVEQLLGQRGVMIRAENLATVSEEAPEAYKNVDRVVEVSHNIGIATKVARLTPIGVTKG